MVTLFLHLVSGARLAFELPPGDASRMRDAVREFWRCGAPSSDQRPELAIGDDDGSEAFIALAHIVAVELAPPVPDPNPADESAGDVDDPEGTEEP